MKERRAPLVWLLAAAILLVAAGLRLPDLDWIPLGNLEALAALAAAAGTPFESPFWQGGPQVVSAAYASLTGVLFSAFGATDGLARLVPALAGFALVGLPLLFVNQVGWIPALGASATLAISTTALAASRTAGGESLGALGVGLLWFAATRRGEQENPESAALAGAALGLALAAGPSAWMGLFGLTLALFMARAAGSGDGDGLALPDWAVGLARQEALLAAGVVFAALSTRFGFRPAILADAIGAPGSWLQGWFIGTGLHFVTALVIVPFYEPLLLIGGVLGGVFALRSQARLSSGLSFWALGALIAYLVYPGHAPVDLIWVVVPGSFMVGFALEAGLTRYSALSAWRAPISLAAVLFALAAFTYLQLEQVGVGAGLVQLAAPERVLFGLAALTFLGALLFMFGFGWSWEETSLALATFATATAAALTFSAGWRLTHDAEVGARELWRHEASTQGVIVLREALAGISNAHLGREAGLQLGAPVAPPPALAWAVRDYEPVQREEGEQRAVPPAILAPEGSEPALPASYLGQAISTTERQGWAGALPPSRLGWWLDREAPTEHERWVLYVRTDVAGLGEGFADVDNEE